jgi:hypothetical protein
MKTLPTLIVAMFLGATAAAAAAAEQATLETITITAKRPHSSLTTVDRVPPQATLEIVAPLPTDMPEAEIDYHMTLVGASPAAPISL